MIDILITVMTPDDVAEAVQLDSENPSAWTAGHFHGLFSQPHGWHFIARAAENRELLGFICGQALLDEGEIHKIAVAVPHRRRRIGRRLLGHALGFLENQGVRTCFLELRAANLPAQKLYQSCGFTPSGRRKKYYTSPGEDAIIMTLHLPEGLTLP